MKKQKRIEKHDEDGSVLDATFREIDEKFAMLNDFAKDWIKMKIMTHITEAYNRGKNENNKNK